MGSVSSNKVPAINFASEDLRPGTTTWCSVRTEVRQALEVYGCFEAVFNGKPRLHQEMLSALEQYFDLPHETKIKYFSDTAFDGYTGINPVMPLLDSVAIHTYELSFERLERFTNLMWPEGNSSFCQNGVKGLEIQAKDGEWISVEPSASSFVVMIGEVFMAWSNDRLHCPLHHVMMIGDDVRYSTALFSHSKGMVQTPEEMVDEEHPLLYKPFDHCAYHAFALTKEAQKFDSQIKGFCGV
ncbi:hypothetical protein AQUCO_00100665v1 [Aquilegia coerulea]|uniref:Isopenicillin N synthase-like Fe(2+) 2OG dioxygenase domain-containing protein n=1 Tax=Aquilegia coerulea TaxID=218851 RepID=A0A2G5FBE6_AQUCA|nr:hypothetical protein AQUCO_00100665v1 [Aquilegia coerulea]